MKYKKLAKSEIQELVLRHKQERDKRICDRIKAVLMYDDKYNLSEIGKVLLLK